MTKTTRAVIAACLVIGAAACQKDEAPMEKPAPPAAEKPAAPEPAPEAPKPAEPAPTEAAPAAEPATAEFDAKTTFNTVCAACHGEGGGGDGPAGVALNPKPASFNKAEFWATRDRAHIMKVIKEGGASVGKSPLMAAFGGQFTDEQVGQLADYVMTFKPAS